MTFTGLRRISDASVEPISLTEAKEYLRVDHDDENSLIEAMVRAARINCERETRRAFVSQTWVLTAAEFPARGLALYNPPLISVDSVEYRDEDGAWQTLADTEYEADLYEEPARLMITGTQPGTGTHRDAWKVTYTAGYGAAAADVPEDIRAAVQLILKSLYEREEDGGTLHDAASRILNNWKIPGEI